jgi:hypothetical protein
LYAVCFSPPSKNQEQKEIEGIQKLQKIPNRKRKMNEKGTRGGGRGGLAENGWIKKKRRLLFCSKNGRAPTFLFFCPPLSLQPTYEGKKRIVNHNRGENHPTKIISKKKPVRRSFEDIK